MLILKILILNIKIIISKVQFQPDGIIPEAAS